MLSRIERLKNQLSKEQFQKQDINDRYDFDNKYSTLQEKFKKATLLAKEDPTWMSFALFPDFNSADSALLLGGKGTDKTKSAEIYSKYDTARWYLQNIGETQRFVALEIFQTIFWHLVYNAPWYFESIEGLDKILNRYITPSDPKENTISINCWESVDLRVTTMLYNYYSATTDYDNNRKVLPDNLDSFTLTIYVNDFRTINNILPNEVIVVPSDQDGNYIKNYGEVSGTVGSIDSLNKGVGYKVKKTSLKSEGWPWGKKSNVKQVTELNPLPLNYFRGKLGFVVTLYGCKFSKETMGEGFGTVSNSEPEQLKRKLTIEFKRSEYELVNEALLYQLVGGDSENENLDKNLTEVYTERYNPAIVRDKRNIRSKVEDRANLAFNRSFDSLDNLANFGPNFLEEKATNNIRATINAYAKRTLKKITPFENLKKNLGNIYKDGPGKGGKLSVGRALADSLRAPRFNPFTNL